MILPGGVGTGVGSMPGTDIREATAIVLGELDLAHLPELPARGIGADMTGRMAALLADLTLDAATWGYRLTGRASSVTRRARDLLSGDLDTFEELWDAAGFAGTGRTVKVQACGPYTLAATVELASGHKALRDHGAVRDLVASAAEGLAEHASEVAARLGAQVIVQVDEPLIGSVLDGTVTPLTRLDPIAPLPVADVADSLAQMAEQIGRPVIVHNCGTPRWDLVSRLPGIGHGVALTSADGPDTESLDGIGALLDRGDALVAGAVPAGPNTPPQLPAEVAATGLAGLVDRIGLPRDVLSRLVIVTPDCGLAGVSPRAARAALATCARTGHLLAGDADAL